MLLKALKARGRVILGWFGRMPPSAGFPYKLTFGLALTIAIDTVVQLIWKTAADTLPAAPSWESIEAIFNQPLFLVVITLMTCQLFNWLAVLGDADLSFAQPFTSISRVTVCLASVYFLHERIAPAQITGIVMVCAGAWCISRTARNTARSGSAPP
jgi:drug/metabolite transporter (DMT)-like permease